MTENAAAQSALAQFAGDWVLDGAQSAVTFRSSSLWGLVKVSGRFTDLRGEGSFGADGTVRGRLVMKAESVRTGMKQRDKHLRSADFFDVAKHPEIVFELSGLTAPDAVHLQLAGTLTVAGNSHPLEFAAQLADASAGAVTITAETTLDRSAWGISFRKSGMTNMSTGVRVSARFTRPA